MSGLPSTGQTIADVVQAALGVYVFISVRSGGLRQKRQRDKRMDDWLEGTEATTAFEAVPAAPLRLLKVEQAVGRLDQSHRVLTHSVALLRNEVKAGLRAASTEVQAQIKERQRVQERDKI